MGRRRTASSLGSDTGHLFSDGTDRPVVSDGGRAVSGALQAFEDRGGRAELSGPYQRVRSDGSAFGASVVYQAVERGVGAG